MARTFTLTSGSYQGRYLQVSCTQTIDIATNTSKIDWTLSSIGGSSNYYSTGATTLTISDQQVYYKARVNWDAKVFPAAKGSTSGTTYIAHNTGGDQGITVKLSTAIYTGTVSEYRGSWQLDNIPRQATITSAPDTIKDTDNPTITFSNPANCTMDVWLELNPVGDHLCVRNNIPNTGSYTWELTESERDELRKRCAKSQCTIRIGLYSHISGVTFADYKDKIFEIQETDKTRPSIAMDITLNNGSLPIKFADMYIQGKSRLNINLTAEGKYGANITNYCVSACGENYYTSPLTTNVLTASGNYDIVATATDTRGFTNTATQQIAVAAYSKPLVIPVGNENAILCYRSDGNGVRVGNSTSVWVKAKRSYYSLSGKNGCALHWRRRLITEAWNDSVHKWQELIVEDEPTDEYNGLIIGEVFELNKSYSVQIRAVDDIGEYDIKEFEIPTQDVALHLGAGGKNVAVGTFCDYSEPYTFYSEWKAIFDKGVHIGEDKLPISDFVIEQGTSGIWTYEKWASGKAVCWGSKSCGTADVSNGWGDESTHLYESKQGYSETYPSGLFKNLPICIMTPYGDGGAMLETIGDGTASQTPQAYIVRPAPNSTLTNTRIEYYVIGKWK